ncbi:hypothetical protein BGX27_002570 [Mortierella sp. AM989]|nr:hypothetical protein BGX27_002570 [Mortierella sp. AM989]
MSASSAHLRWALEKKRGKEHVFLPNFVRRFGLSDRVSATREFESLLNLNNIRSRRRKKIAKAFEYFQDHHQEQFWAERALEVNTEVTIKRTGAIMQDAGVNEVKMACERYFSNNEGRSLEMDLEDDSESESGSESESESESEEEGTASSSEVNAGAETSDPTTKAPVGEGDAELLEDLEDLEQQLTRAKVTPFYDLIQYVFNKVQGKPANLPEVPEKFTSPNFKEIFVYARTELMKASLLKRSKSKVFVIDKDVLVALSGIVNTLSPVALRTFTIAPTVKSKSLLPELTQKQPAVKDLLRDLLSALCPGISEDPYTEPTLWGLQGRVWELLSQMGKGAEPKSKDEKVRLAVLMIINHLCGLISSNQLSPPTSEHVSVSVWSFVLGLLFGGQAIRVIPGELGSSATKNARLLVENEFGKTTKYVCGRKVDLSVRIYADFSWENEISVYEFKSGTVADESCEQQQRKAVRLNAAILLELEKQGVDITKVFPVIAEGRGLSMDLYTLRRHGDVLGAGRAVPSRAHQKVCNESG